MVRKGSSRRDRSSVTIIRRTSKKGHDAAHGGAWKVAFADFTLAMMALFMTLWIVNSVSKADREQIVAALHGESIFNGGGLVPLNKVGQKKTPTSGSKKQVKSTPQSTPAEAVKQMASVNADAAKKAQEVDDKLVEMKKKSARELGELATDINVIAQKAHMETNLEMEIVPQGLRVLIKDDQNRSMFERGSAKIIPFFGKLLVSLAPVFDSLDNKIIITGHTDAMQYKSDLYNNWNLSGDRALSARRALEQAGMPADKVMQVSAMADQMLLDSKDPNGAENRRIEIMVLTKSASDTLYQFFGQHGEKVVAPIAKKLEAEPQFASHKKHG